MLNSQAYLERIGYFGPTRPTTETLRQLHRNHLFAVPFENLNIPAGRRIACDEQAFVRKIVDERRGGFCYELNGAFAVLLRELGFAVTLLSARVPREDGRDGPEFDHLALRVDLDEPWLADVGFGDSFVDPLLLRSGIEQAQYGHRFRLTGDAGSMHMEVATTDGNWRRQFSFALAPRKLEDFAAMCEYHQTSADSPFTRRRICTRATPQGRITLTDGKLIVTREGEREETALGSEAEWRTALKEHFEIEL